MSKLHESQRSLVNRLIHISMTNKYTEWYLIDVNCLKCKLSQSFTPVFISFWCRRDTTGAGLSSSSMLEIHFLLLSYCLQNNGNAINMGSCNCCIKNGITNCRKGAKNQNTAYTWQVFIVLCSSLRFFSVLCFSKPRSRSLWKSRSQSQAPKNLGSLESRSLDPKKASFVKPMSDMGVQARGRSPQKLQEFERWACMHGNLTE